jgi:hypothetical protein
MTMIQHKKSKFRCNGYIELFNENGEFIVIKKYRSRLHRQKILDMWQKVYALPNITYYLIIKPMED